MTTGKFSLQWVNTSDFKRPMSSMRFNLRDAMVGGSGESGLTCGRLHLDQVHVQFRPSKKADGSVNITDAELRPGDSRDYDWTTETLQLYVRITPGERHTLYTSGPTTNGSTSDFGNSMVPHPQRSLVYSVALGAAHSTAATTSDAHCRSYRPIRDLPVLRDSTGLTDIQIDLFWPLLQGDHTNAVWWSVPDYRILRVLCEFSYTGDR